MSQKIIHEIGRTQRIKILQLIKCSQGLSVRELSERLKMSYMGVKQHCLSMEKEGYLKAWRKPKEGKVGRPEIAYLITAKANELFPREAHRMTLDLLKEAEKLFGSSAADKLLFSYYETRFQQYQSRMKGGDFQTRITSFVKIRNEEGFMCAFVPANPPQLLEYHSPFFLVQKKYPLVARLEGELVAKLLDTPVQRTEREVAGQYQAVYSFELIQQNDPAALPVSPPPEDASPAPALPAALPEPPEDTQQPEQSEPEPAPPEDVPPGEPQEPAAEEPAAEENAPAEPAGAEKKADEKVLVQTSLF